MTDRPHRPVTEEDLQIVNAHFRCECIGEVMLERGYWQMNNVEKRKADVCNSE